MPAPRNRGGVSEICLSWRRLLTDRRSQRRTKGERKLAQVRIEYGVPNAQPESLPLWITEAVTAAELVGEWIDNGDNQLVMQRGKKK